jgi:transposase
MKKLSLGVFLRKYPNNDSCLEELFKKSYPSGVNCKKCQKITKYFKLNNRTAYSFLNVFVFEI